MIIQDSGEKKTNFVTHKQILHFILRRMYDKFMRNVRAAVKSLSKYFTVQTTSLTNLNHNPPHKPDMYITPQNHTPDNNF
jgi:hypothetical protein